MPIYAYKCESCGHAKDVLQKMSDPLLTECPACGASTFVKQLTAAGFQLKGSGWYATDFKNGGSTSAPAVDKTDSGSATKSETGSGETKSETKSESKIESSPTTVSSSKPTESASTKSPAASGGGCAPGCGCH
jgi:putative FmdB family regulatory protein